MDTHDQQIAKFVNSGLGRMMVNAGSSESYGVEASFLASINKNLNMNVSYGYTHSTFKKYDGGKQLDAKPDFRHELYRSRKNLLD